jgi:hypothetical protein
MKPSAKEIKELRRMRAGWEFDLNVRKFLDKFKSKEEPSVTLTTKEKIRILSDIVTKSIPNLF